MAGTTRLSCRCGKVHLEIAGTPILSAECCCNSCREAASRIEGLPGAGQVAEPNGTTRFELYRKDRVRLYGSDNLGALHLTPSSPTRRVIATCCNTPIFLEFKNGHWLSLYGRLWPQGSLPPLEMRTMAKDRLPGSAPLADDVPNLKTQSLTFFARLMGAWIAMGFRSPKIDVKGEINA